MSFRERINQLRTRRAEIVHEQNAILAAENPTADDLARWDALDGEFRALTAEVERLETQESRNAALETVVRNPDLLPQGDNPRGSEGRTDEAQQTYARTFETYVRRGLGEMTPDEQRTLRTRYADLGAESRALGTLTGPIGGYTVPDEMARNLQQTMLFFGGMLESAETLDTSTGAPLPWPTLNDTSRKGRRLAENGAVTQTDPTFGARNLNAYVYSSDAILVPYTLLQDTGIPLENVLNGLLGERLGRILNEEFTTGTGASMPEGVATNVTVGKTGASGQTGTVKYDDLIDLIHSVDRAYRNARGRFMMHDLSLAIARKLKNGDGDPIFQVGYQAGEPDRLLGYPVTINNDLDEMAANAKSILFGDFFAGYLIRRVQDVQLVRATERWIDNLQVGFFAFARYDGILREPNAIKAYKNAAS